MTKSKIKWHFIGRHDIIRHWLAAVGIHWHDAPTDFAVPLHCQRKIFGVQWKTFLSARKKILECSPEKSP